MKRIVLAAYFMRPGIGIAAILLTAQLACPQVPGPKFEVTSVKPSARSSAFTWPNCTNGLFHSRASSLDNVLEWAFDLRGFQGREMEHKLPDWASDDDFDIEATAGRADVPEAECRLMVQTLLAERFKLVFHWDTREGRVYDLLIAPGGHKLKKVTEADTGRGYFLYYNGLGLFGPPVTGITMQQLAKSITQDGPVYDKTGLEGLYKFTLTYSTLPPDRATDPNIETALPQQLGLKLQKGKGPVEYLVVDRIEKPDPN